MNRRDFTKGLAALPLAGAVKSYGSICSSTDCKLNEASSYLLVILEGAFAVVVNTASPWHVQAFTPKHNGEHFFAFNRRICEIDTQYGFLLQQDGLTQASQLPCIHNSSANFCAENTPSDLSMEDHFILLDLPAPQAIVVWPSRFEAVMESDESENPNYVPIPGTQILVYEIKDGNAIQMYGSEYGEVVPLPTLKGKKVSAFIFEIGLPNLLGGRDSDPNGSHAIEFYNQSVLPHFSELAGDKNRRIKKIRPRKASANYVIKHSLPGGFQGLEQALDEYMLTTTFECKIGGLTVTSSLRI